jgi:ABC-type phosphate transport system permease subunit
MGIEWAIFLGITLVPACVMPLLARGPHRARALAYAIPPAVITTIVGVPAIIALQASAELDPQGAPLGIGMIGSALFIALVLLFPVWLGRWWAAFLREYQQRTRPVLRATLMTVVAAPVGIFCAYWIDLLLARFG